LPLSRDTRQRVKRAAEAARLDRPARWAWEATHPGVRRDRLHMRNFELLLAFTVRADGNCVDVGAHSGELLRHMVRLAPAGRHLAFEPLPAFADQLRRDHPGVEVHQVALWDEPGTTTFQHVAEEPAYSGLRRQRYPGRYEPEEMAVETARLDDVLPAGYVPALLKIDVEGAEGHVLTGALQTIERHRPAIWFEHMPESAATFGTTSAGVHAMLTGAGLRVFDAEGGGPHSRGAFEDSLARGVHNFLARE
jgi:FkbM family methyltransferase